MGSNLFIDKRQLEDKLSDQEREAFWQAIIMAQRLDKPLNADIAKRFDISAEKYNSYINDLGFLAQAFQKYYEVHFVIKSYEPNLCGMPLYDQFTDELLVFYIKKVFSYFLEKKKRYPILFKFKASKKIRPNQFEAADKFYSTFSQAIMTAKLIDGNRVNMADIIRITGHMTASAQKKTEFIIANMLIGKILLCEEKTNV